MSTQEMSMIEPKSSYSALEKSFADSNRMAKYRVLATSGILLITATVILLKVILSLGEMNGDVTEVFSPLSSEETSSTVE